MSGYQPEQKGVMPPPPSSFDHTKAHRAAQEMVRSGGDFIGALGATFFKADMKNARRMYEAFRPEFDQYYEYFLAREKRDAQQG